MPFNPHANYAKALLTMDLWRLNDGTEIYIEQWDSYFNLNPLTVQEPRGNDFASVIQYGFITEPTLYNPLPIYQEVAPGDFWEIPTFKPRMKSLREIYEEHMKDYRKNYGD